MPADPITASAITQKTAQIAESVAPQNDFQYALYLPILGLVVLAFIIVRYLSQKNKLDRQAEIEKARQLREEELKAEVEKARLEVPKRDGESRREACTTHAAEIAELKVKVTERNAEIQEVKDNMRRNEDKVFAEIKTLRTEMTQNVGALYTKIDEMKKDISDEVTTKLAEVVRAVLIETRGA